MVRIRGWWLTGTSAALLSLNTAQAQSVPHDVIVRVYNTAEMPRREVTAAERVAETIFHRARIRLRWRECQTASGPSAASDDPCADLLQPREVIARLAVIGGAHPSASVLGYALVDGDAQMGTLATIFADHVTAAAARFQVERATLLGRTLAHELGHLLLGTVSHTRRGLMRAWWTDVDLRRVRGKDWQFSDAETRHMNAALALSASGETINAGVHTAAALRPEPQT